MAATDEPAGYAPDGYASLGEAGSALHQALIRGREFDPGAHVLLLEACRTADRLDRLDKFLRGEEREWISVEKKFYGSESKTEIVIDEALAEARQQANVLRQLITTLGLGKVSAAKAAGRSALDQLADRRASRQPKAAAK